MKKMILLALSILSLNALASSRQTSFEAVARKAAFDHAYNVFSKLANQDSDFSVSLKAQDRVYFVFNAVARVVGERCYFEVFVSKENGKAFNVNEPICD